MVHIDPTTNLIDIPLPLCGGRLCILVASIDKLLYPALFDVFIGLESEFFLDFLLDGETMTVPSPDAIHTLPAHSPVASDRVFHDRRQE